MLGNGTDDKLSDKTFLVSPVLSWKAPPCLILAGFHHSVSQSPQFTDWRMWSTALLMFSICSTVVPSQDLLSDLAALDSAITAVLDQLPDQVTTARLNIAANTARANRFSLSYGIAVALGTLLTIDVRNVLLLLEGSYYKYYMVL